MPNCLILSELFMSFAFGGQRYYFLTDFFLRLNSHKMGQIKKTEPDASDSVKRMAG